MATYDLDQLIQMWQTEKLTAEQAVGQMLLHLQALSQRVSDLERRAEQARQSKSSGSPPKT